MVLLLLVHHPGLPPSLWSLSSSRVTTISIFHAGSICSSNSAMIWPWVTWSLHVFYFSFSWHSLIHFSEMSFLRLSVKRSTSFLAYLSLPGPFWSAAVFLRIFGVCPIMLVALQNTLSESLGVPSLTTCCFPLYRLNSVVYGPLIFRYFAVCWAPSFAEMRNVSLHSLLHSQSIRFFCSSWRFVLDWHDVWHNASHSRSSLGLGTTVLPGLSSLSNIRNQPMNDARFQLPCKKNS